MLRDFSWVYFSETGDIHAYLLYREHHSVCHGCEEEKLDSALSELGESKACL